MALSGTIYKNVGSHWRLSVSWTGSQSISGNYTDVTAKMYWESLDSYGSVYSSATKDGGIEIDGTWDYFSGSGLAALSGKQKKLIHTYTRRINHESDGDGDVAIDGFFDAEVTLGGTYYGRIDLTQKTFPLDKIPRKSTLTSSASFTAGSDKTYYIDPADDSFDHTLFIDLQESDGTWTFIKSLAYAPGETSKNTSFSVADKTAIFNVLNGRSSCSMRINLHTDQGSTDLGYNTYNGTCTAPQASYPNSSFDHEVYIDQTISVDLWRGDSEFDHKIEFVCNGQTIKTFNDIATSVAWTPTTTEQNTMYGLTPNANEVDGAIKVTTYYNGVQVRSMVSQDLDFHVRNANPTFSSSQISYADVNTTTTALTGNDQYIIQNKSDPEVTILSAATANKGASISSYIVTLAGQEKSLSSIGSHTFNPVDSSSNLTLSVKAVDSRGNSTIVTKTVTVIPYDVPVINASIGRVGGFESTTVLESEGEYDTLTVDSVDKNSVSSAQYRYKDRSTTSWTAWANLSYTQNNGVVTVTDESLTLDNTKSWDVEVKMVDALSTTTVALVVETGKPIFHIDPILKSIGFGDFPTSPNEFRISGRMVFAANQWANAEMGEGFGVMDLQNSDITGLNGLYFNDVANNAGEGLMFIKSGKTSGSSNTDDYDQFHIQDALFKLNQTSMFTFDPARGIVMPANKYWDTGGQAGLDMNNSDIVGANNIYFADEVGSGEGLKFPKTGKAGSTVDADYDGISLLDGVMYINGTTVITENQDPLWSGGLAMTGSQTCTPSKALYQCANGWILVWADFNTPSTTNDYNYHTTVIPKRFYNYDAGGSFYCMVPSFSSGTDQRWTMKTIYINSTTITGHDDNWTTYGDRQDVILRHVFPF